MLPHNLRTQEKKSTDKKPKALLYLLACAVAYQVLYQALMFCILPPNEMQHVQPEPEVIGSLQPTDFTEVSPNPIEDPEENVQELLAVGPVGHAALAHAGSRNKQSPNLLMQSKSAASNSGLPSNTGELETKPTPVSLGTTVTDYTDASTAPKALSDTESSPVTAETVTPKATTMDKWGLELATVQMKLDAEMSALMQSHAEHEHRASRGQSTMQDRIRALHQEVCMNPMREGFSSCQQSAKASQAPSQDLTTNSSDHHVKMQSSTRPASGLRGKVASAQPIKTGSASGSGHAREHAQAMQSECMRGCSHAWDYNACVHDCSRASRRMLAERVAAIDSQLAKIVQGHAAAEHEMNEKAMALGRELCAEPQRQGTPACATFIAAPAAQAVEVAKDSPVKHFKTSSEWASDLAALQEKLDTRLHSLKDAHHRHHHAAVDHPPTQDSVEYRIKALQEEMCADPRRRNRPSCKNLHKHEQAHESRDTEGHTVAEHMAQYDAELAKIKEHHAAAEREMLAKVTDLRREMCAEDWRRETPACKEFLVNAAPGSQTPSLITETESPETPTSLSLGRAKASRVLHMHAHGGDGEELEVPEKSGRLRGVVQGTRHHAGPPLLVGADELRGAHWEGHIPKVTCIMAVPGTTHAQAQLRYAIDTFRAQQYEGSKELILLYRFEDKETAKLAKRLADGFVVKAVAVHNDDVPSTTSLRYGAWASDHDAEIVARWDLDDWHHPQRLAMQVRALVLSGRPACILKRWSEDLTDGKRAIAEGRVGWAGSLVGERAWMEKHWHPLLPGEDKELEATTGFVTQLDMPELLAHKP